ncbi:unnamed protein product [Ectocarpus fasciculatus]
MEESIRCDGSVGEIFSLEWMLRKRLEEDLSRNWPPAPRREGSSDNKRDAGARAREEGAVCKKDEQKCANDTVRRMCECTGVVEELAIYALQVSKDDEQQAHNLLLDMVELQTIFEVVEHMILLHAVAAHPRNKELQCDFVCQVETGERPSWTIPSPPPLTMEGKGGERLGRTAELENLAEANGNLLVDKKGETVDLLIDVFYMAMYGRRPELAFPSTVQLGDVESGKSDEQKGYDDADGDGIGNAREKWNPLSYAYPLLRWLLSAHSGARGKLSEDED